jgi:XTP/dITP diphosphohydrolase
MHKLIFATNNAHKLQEIKEILKDNFEILGLKEYGVNEDIPETGKDLSENATLKSKYIYDRFKVDVFSDDTGLEIEALDNRPGVYSARYAGEDGNSEANIKKVLSELKDKSNRKARFRTVISLIMDGKEFQFEGKVEGKISTEKHGEDGFGYDPVFVPEDYDITFAEMSSMEKNKISHRGRAMAKLVEFLKHQ